MKTITREIRIIISTILHVIATHVWFVVFIGMFIFSFNNFYDYYYWDDPSYLLIGLIQFFSASIASFLLAAIFTSLGNVVSPNKI
jgi:hypothetical protein